MGGVYRIEMTGQLALSPSPRVIGSKVLGEGDPA